MEPLFDLIKKMDAAEKGYFKKFSSIGKKHEKNVGELLFEAIDKMKVYDESGIRKKYRNEKFITYLPVAKQQLHEQILRALSNYHGDTTIYQTIDNLLMQANVLFQKSLIPSYRKLLFRAKELALESEYFSRLGDILEREFHDAVSQTPSPEKDARIEKLYEEIEVVNKQELNLRQYIYLYARQMSITSESYQIRDKAIEKRHLEIMKHPIMQNESCALSVKARLYFYHNSFIYHSVFHQEKEAYATAQKMLVTCQSSIIYTKHEPFPYLTAYLYVLNGAYRNNDLPAMEKYLEQLRNLSFDIESARTAQFMYYMKNALFYYSQIKNEEAFLRLVNEADETLKKLNYNIRKDYLLVIFDHIALGLMKFGKYTEAIDWLELYRNKFRGNVRYDLQTSMHFHLLVAHYELGNYTLVQNLIVPVYRFIVRTGQQSKFEKLALRTFRKISDPIMIKEHPELLEKLKQKLNATHTDEVSNQNKDLSIFLLEFIESKLQKKKYHEYLSK
ncbi:MAG: hypothetical protein U0T74_05960 [Chitinophagales bacterium]